MRSNRRLNPAASAAVLLLAVAPLRLRSLLVEVAQGMTQSPWNTLLGRFAWAILASCLAPSVALAAPLAGTFNIEGSFTLSAGPPQTISWVSDVAPFPANKALVAATGLSGSFAGLGGTQATILSVSNPPATTGGAGFPAQVLLTFDAAPALGALSIDFVFPGVNSSAGCFAVPPAVGQICTPPGSPFDFENTAGGGSSVGFVFAGTAQDGSTWTGSFTSQFGIPYQALLTTLGSGGSISSAYSATFTVVPEPGTGLLVMDGMLGLAVTRRYRHARA